MEYVTVVAAVVQTGAAVIALFVTIRLARVARDTLRANEVMANSAEAQMNVMREQIELEHRPNLVVSGLYWPEGRLELFNLGRWPVLVSTIILRVNTAEHMEFLALAVPAGGFATYSLEPEQFLNFGERPQGRGSLKVEFFYGSTERRRYRLEGVEFHTTQKPNAVTPGVVIYSQGRISEHAGLPLAPTLPEGPLTPE